MKNPFGKKHQSSEELLQDLDVGDELGRGGFSIVKAVHRRGEDAGILTAMKITPLALLESSMGMGRAEVKARLERMRKVSNANKNPHIISFIDWRMSKTELFTFGELCRGSDMFEKIVNSPDGRFTEEQAKGAARNLLQAVHDTHANGIVHRDIKPENIFYRLPESDPADLVLADFGGCVDEVWSPEQQMRGTVGSPGYLPPEMAAGQPYTMLVDEWSSGVTIYEALTGRSPFISQEPADLAREVLSRAIPYPKQYWGHLSPESRNFVQKLLEKDPRRRMSAAQALKHPWLAGKLARHDSLDSDTTLESDGMESDTMDSDTSVPELTRVATRKSTIPRAASFGRPDPLAAVCTRCVFTKAHGDVQMIDTSDMVQGRMSSADMKKLAELEGCSEDARDVEDRK